MMYLVIVCRGIDDHLNAYLENYIVPLQKRLNNDLENITENELQSAISYCIYQIQSQTIPGLESWNYTETQKSLESELCGFLIKPDHKDTKLFSRFIVMYIVYFNHTSPDSEKGMAVRSLLTKNITHRVSKNLINLKLEPKLNSLQTIMRGEVVQYAFVSTLGMLYLLKGARDNSRSGAQ